MAVNGVCLTAVETNGGAFRADVMVETLRRSSLGPLATGQHEPAHVRSALDQLGALDPPVTSILLEGGPHLAGAFMDAAEIDEIRLFLAPLLLGGRLARVPVEGAGVERIDDALRAQTLDCELNPGGDVLVSARLREW